MPLETIRALIFKDGVDPVHDPGLFRFVRCIQLVALTSTVGGKCPSLCRWFGTLKWDVSRKVFPATKN